MNTICLGRAPTSYALTYGGTPRYQQIPVAVEQIHLADYILSCGKQRLVIQTPVKVACVESGKLLWERPITRRSTTTISSVPGKSRFTLNLEEQLRYRVDLYDATGKELKKFRLEHGPVISPFTITEKGDLAYFFNGNLITCTIP